MKLKIPHKVRMALYIVTAVGSPVVSYLLDKGVIGEREAALWLAEVTVVSALAAFNVTASK